MHRTDWTHRVRIYHNERELLATVAGYAADAWSLGGECLVIASGGHAVGIHARLASAALTATPEQHILTELDAAETLEQFMVRGSPDRLLFDKSVGHLIRRHAAASPGLWVFGEMVDMLWAEGNIVGALELEQLWNTLQAATRFTLLCAYGSRRLNADQQASVETLHRSALPSRPMLPSSIPEQ
jgi:DcmR-like sensory protein